MKLMLEKNLKTINLHKLMFPKCHFFRLAEINLKYCWLKLQEIQFIFFWSNFLSTFTLSNNPNTTPCFCFQGDFIWHFIARLFLGIHMTYIYDTMCFKQRFFTKSFFLNYKEMWVIDRKLVTKIIYIFGYVLMFFM